MYEGTDNLRARLEDRSLQLKAGQIRLFVPQWEEISQDKEILKMLEGADIEFSEIPLPPQKRQKLVFSQYQCKAIDGEIEELLRKEVIVACEHTEGEFIFPCLSDSKKITNTA